MEHRLRRPVADDRGDRGQIGDGADLVVDRHDADDADVRSSQRVGELIEIDVAGSIDTDDAAVAASSTGCSTAWCSAAEQTADARERRPITVLSASVPQPVNTTSPGLDTEHVGDLVTRLVDRPGVRRGRTGASRSGWRSAR